MIIYKIPRRPLWKPLASRGILKPYEKEYLLAVSLNRFKGYPSKDVSLTKGNQTFLCDKSMENSPYQTCFKTMKIIIICNKPMRTISASVGLGCYKWYKRPTQCDVSMSKLSPSGHEGVRQQGR